MKQLTAIVKTTCVDVIVKSLGDIGAREMTISEIKGVGEQVQLYRPYTIHTKIDIIIPDERADEVSNVILKHAHTGFAGDGIIAVYPVDYIIKIRTKERQNGPDEHIDKNGE
ncbi:MAG: P-II family nitrogen regulator [Nitrospirota bacterium]